MNRISFLYKAFLFGTALLWARAAQAQKTFEGTVEYEYEITSEDISPEVRAMLPRSSTLYVKGDMSRMEMSMGPMDMTIIANNRERTGTTLMNIMNKKVAIKIDSAEIGQALEQIGEFEIRYEDEKREILGYDCRKALLIRGEQVDTIWYTRELPSLTPSLQTSLPQIKGFPLEAYTIQQGVDVKLKVKNINEGPVDASLFEIPAGYKIVEKNDLQSALMGQ